MSDAISFGEENSSKVSHQDMANAIRALSMDAVEKAKSGHPGMPMGFADVATVLFTKFLRFNPQNPNWPNRDRFILSAGHGSMLLYSLLYLTGYPEMEIDNIKNFRQLGSNTPGHPEYGDTIGVETTTGPLGQGLANAVGMALAERILNDRYGNEIINHFTYTAAGDGCLMEGISQEAITLAGHLKLGKLVVLFDDNKISIDGSTDLTTSEDNIKRFEAAGWHVAQADGHDPEAITEALSNAKAISDKPSMIAFRTVIGFGAPNKRGTAGVHGAPLGADEIGKTRDELNWGHAPFEIPENILSAWRSAGSRCQGEFESWLAAWDQVSLDDKETIEKSISESTESAVVKAVLEVKNDFITEQAKLATRVSSQKVLEKVIPVLPGLICGSADLTGSNGTKTSHYKPFLATIFLEIICITVFVNMEWLQL